MFRQALAIALGQEPWIAGVSEAGSLGGAREFLPVTDVVVINLWLPDGEGVDLIRNLRSTNRDIRVLVLTDGPARAAIARAVEAGAEAALDTATALTDVLDAIRHCARREAILAPSELIELLRLAASERERNRSALDALSRLTPREREVLQHLAEGLGDKDIADRLCVSHETVRTHMVNILGKLHVESRLQALLVAARYGTVTLQLPQHRATGDLGSRG